jgi:MoxR-like ATPase
LLGGKARALLNGRTHVSTDDVRELAAPVLRHRIVANFTAESEGITTDHVIRRLVDETPSKEGELTSDPRLQKIFAA